MKNYLLIILQKLNINNNYLIKSKNIIFDRNKGILKSNKNLNN